MSLLSAVFSVSFLFSIIRVTTPILFGGLSSIMSEESGVSNIGIEGMMLISALTGVIASAYLGANPWIGLLAAVVMGALLGTLLVYLVMKLNTDPIIAGVAYNLTAGGATVFFLYLACGDKGVSSSLISGSLPTINIPILDQIPFIGDILSGHNILTYLSLLLIPLITILIYRTKFGLHLRSAGENPVALTSVGISVEKTRYLALAISGALAGLGGAFMSMGYVSYFIRDMIAGRGFIALAAAALGNRKPLPTFIACLLFGAAEAFAMNPATQGIGLPIELVQMLPYLVTIIALVIYSYKRKKKVGNL